MFQRIASATSGMGAADRGAQSEILARGANLGEPDANPMRTERTAGRHIDGIVMCCQTVGMTRTQIQLPDDVFARAKKLCQAREISLAELARRGIEYILSVYAPEPDANREWQPPKPRRLGWKGLSDAKLKAQAQWTDSKLSHARPRRK